MTQAFLRRVLQGDATKEEAKDTGMAIVLLLLLVWASRRRDGYVGVAMIVLIIDMAVPQIFRPLAVLWFGLSHLLGAVASKVMLTVIFFFVVTPIGLWRRMTGSDSLKLKAFKASTASAMKERNHTFVGKDLDLPY